ncbi:response regulator [Hymenobacter psychrophilus]|uniref:cAMP-binding domain of CRP or a regulatory subunit of cAMP-dependent protein kinases n=1 Tax=Hymenobacter psychrophilus TaxID=651662 RepID=A0A1H3K8Q7_9BACT|nr:response regulator [Hymenobacter psychrophilus]SDY47968.1 cAMP-binding domain of CRP or a regulatory subunit of cAMP-dependent protein kinases [Hymenobacter psychrophilus]
MKTILLIEDNAPIRENTAEILEMAGYAVQTAENGKLGVALALATPPDLVVCDIMMPVLDGYGVLHIFTQNPALASIPFIFLTAKTERTDQRRGMELGADDYLTKPFSDTELLSAITSRLGRFQQLRPDYDVQAEGLDGFLDDAQAVGSLHELTMERRPRSIRKKQDIYREGDEAVWAYFVRAGRVKTVQTTDGGKELITGLYQAGDFFGYLPLLEHTPHQDTAVALDDAEVVYLPRDDFRALLERNPAVSQQFIRLLAGRVREREALLLGMAYDSIRRRVADTLLRLHEQAAATADPAAEATIQLSRDDMAAIVGAAPESLIRTLSEFRHDGLIEVTPQHIRVLEADRLRQAHW